MVSLEEVDFALGVVRVNRRAIDRMASVLDEELQRNRKALVKWLEGRREFPEREVWELVADPLLQFSFYCLAIVHCYSGLENNRRRICERKTGASSRGSGTLHKIKDVTKLLESFGVRHERMRCYKTVEEFRVVNNAIKHERQGSSTEIKTKSGRIYRVAQLKDLYHRRARHLDTYLADLYRKVLGRPAPEPVAKQVSGWRVAR
jgi:hypothetical protein